MAKIIITEFLNRQRTLKNTFLQRCTNGQQVCEKKLTMTNHQRNANQNQIRYHITSHLLGWPLLKKQTNKQKTTHVDQDVEKKKPLNTIGKNVNWYSHYRKQSGGSSVN